MIIIIIYILLFLLFLYGFIKYRQAFRKLTELDEFTKEQNEKFQQINKNQLCAISLCVLDVWTYKRTGKTCCGAFVLIHLCSP